MHFRIQYLNLLILFATLNPICLMELVKMSYAIRQKSFSKKTYFITLFILYINLIMGVYLLYPLALKGGYQVKSLWLFVAIIAGPCIVLLEMSFSYLIVFLKEKKLVKIVINDLKSKERVSGVWIVLIGILEEIVYRKIWFFILLGIGVNVYLVILISAIVYALNHLSLGIMIFYQKLLAGIVFGLLFYVSGYLIAVPIIAHALQNCLVVLLSHYTSKGVKQ